MKKSILFLIMGIFFLSTISALEMSAEYDTNIIVRDLENSIKLNLEIENASEGLYNLYTLADVSIQPSEMFSINEDPFKKEFTIAPTKNLREIEGYYTFAYTLNHRGFEKTDKKIIINLMNLEDVIEISSDSIEPTSGKISFYIQNKESVQLDNLSAKFSSILFKGEKTFSIGPNERLEISVDVDENKMKKTKAGVYIIESVFQTKTGTKKIDGTLYLGEKKGITSTEDKSGFLIKTETIIKTNSGNILEDIQIKTKRNIFSRLFTSFNIEPTLIERNGAIIQYTWVKEKLAPAETYIVKTKTNYILPFLILVVVILALLGFKRFSESKIEIKKSVSHVKTKNSQFALKIQISVKAKKDIENVTLIDKIPAMVKIYNKFGIVKPDKIDTASRRLHWNIGDLNTGEERLFNYIVYSKVGIVGKFVLPNALAVFEKEGKIHETNSNKVFFMSDQVKGD
jgi:hypothetical protein